MELNALNKKRIDMNQEIEERARELANTTQEPFIRGITSRDLLKEVLEWAR